MNSFDGVCNSLNSQLEVKAGKLQVVIEYRNDGGPVDGFISPRAFRRDSLRRADAGAQSRIRGDCHALAGVGHWGELRHFQSRRRVASAPLASLSAELSAGGKHRSGK